MLSLGAPAQGTKDAIELIKGGNSNCIVHVQNPQPMKETFLNRFTVTKDRSVSFQITVCILVLVVVAVALATALLHL